MTGPDRARIAELVPWPVHGAAGSSRPEQVVSETCERLLAAGVPLKRVAVFVRLDFTCIGPAVNLAARLQGLAATEGWPLA